MNRLATEISPYLRQHADNPVDWYPWGTAAFAKAKAEDKPILLSIGYSACHWCHVFMHESFEDAETAALMNKLFVNIKVDREERPDIDHIYIEAVQAMSVNAGWPLTVFLTPDGRPFYGGSYYPPEETAHLPSFRRVLQAVADAYQQDRERLNETANDLVNHLKQVEVSAGEAEAPGDEVLKAAFERLADEFDEQFGGLGTAPKFPQPMIYDFLLRYASRRGSKAALDRALLTLDTMASGGIFDQIGGGFHRYAVDAAWTIPHFEKMLYDNALLPQLYTHAWQTTGTTRYRNVAEQTIDFVLRELALPGGGFASALDADSEGEEGLYYLWTPQQLIRVIGPEMGRLLNDWYGITSGGNFEGSNVLQAPRDPEELADELGMDLEKLARKAERSRMRLLAARQKRIPPARDEKVVTSWNGLMLGALAEAALAFDRQDYREAGIQIAEFISRKLRHNGHLWHSWYQNQASGEGFLEDYAFLADGLIKLHAATLDERWLDEASMLAQVIVDEFWDSSSATFFDIGARHENLIVRPANKFDNAYPSGGSAAVNVLLRLARLNHDPSYTTIATTAIKHLGNLLSTTPAAFSNWLNALDFQASASTQIVVVGSPSEAGTNALLKAIGKRYLPNKLLIGYDPAKVDRSSTKGITTTRLRKDYPMIDDQPTAYVCGEQACFPPVHTPMALRKQLDAASTQRV